MQHLPYSIACDDQKFVFLSYIKQFYVGKSRDHLVLERELIVFFIEVIAQRSVISLSIVKTLENRVFFSQLHKTIN